MNIVDVEQGTREWMECRLGSVTSSRVAAVVKKRTRGTGELACREALRYDLIGERLTGEWQDNYVSAEMREGKIREPLAAGEYEVQMEVSLDTVGYIYHPMIKWAGASPDRLLYEHGKPVAVVEFKCPKVKTHISYLRSREIPEEYIPQLIWQLACGEELEYVDFVSFHPAFREPEQRLFRKRVYRDGKLGADKVGALIRGYEADVEQFLSEVERDLRQIQGFPGSVTGIEKPNNTASVVT